MCVIQNSVIIDLCVLYKTLSLYRAVADDEKHLEFSRLTLTLVTKVEFSRLNSTFLKNLTSAG